jgi:hypothetical protein
MQFNQKLQPKNQEKGKAKEMMAVKLQSKY